jgi:hypothetical protein
MVSFMSQPLYFAVLIGLDAGWTPCFSDERNFTRDENRDYDRRVSAALTMLHPYIRKSWH